MAEFIEGKALAGHQSSPASETFVDNSAFEVETSTIHPPAGAPPTPEDNEDSDDEELDRLMADGELKDVDGLFSNSLSDKMGNDIISEIKAAVYAARYFGPMLMCLGLYIAYQITIAPYPLNGGLDRSFHVVKDLGLARPMLTEHEQRVVRVNTMHGETAFQLPAPMNDEIKLRFHSSADQKGGHAKAPELFYNGVMFGITSGNSHSHKYTAVNEDIDRRRLSAGEPKRDLSALLGSLKPQPTHILPRQVQNNATGWMEDGYGVYYSYEDLKAQGKLSSDKLKPWKRVLEDVLGVAREFRQVYVTVWYPHEFGDPGAASAASTASASSRRAATAAAHSNEAQYFKEDPHRYKTILQQIIPTRTGIGGISSTVAVWLSAVNKVPARRRKLQVDPHVVKPWSKDDHWTHYRVGGSKYVKYTDEDLKAMNYQLDPGVEGRVWGRPSKLQSSHAASGEGERPMWTDSLQEEWAVEMGHSGVGSDVVDYW